LYFNIAHSTKKILGTGPGTRTPNQLIKSQLLGNLNFQSVRWFAEKDNLCYESNLF